MTVLDYSDSTEQSLTESEKKLQSRGKHSWTDKLWNSMQNVEKYGIWYVVPVMKL